MDTVCVKKRDFTAINKVLLKKKKHYKNGCIKDLTLLISRKI